MAISPILVFGCVISVIGWIVACAAIASMQAFNFTLTDTTTGTSETFTLPGSSFKLSFEWFVLSWQFFMLVLICVLAFMKKLRQTHSAVNAHLVFASVLWAIFANNSYQAVRGFSSTAAFAQLTSDGYYPNARLNSLIAGSCIIIAGNFFASFGMYCEDDIVEVADKPAAKPVPTTEVPVEPSAV